MDADGQNLHDLTNDQQVVADSQWSFDGKKIIFRQSRAIRVRRRASAS